MYGTAIGAFCCGINVGSFVALCSGAILPPENDHEALKASEMWRVIFGFTLPLYVFIIVVLLTVIKDDSPKFLLIQRKREQCLTVV